MATRTSYQSLCKSLINKYEVLKKLLTKNHPSVTQNRLCIFLTLRDEWLTDPRTFDATRLSRIRKIIEAPESELASKYTKDVKHDYLESVNELFSQILSKDEKDISNDYANKQLRISQIETEQRQKKNKTNNREASPIIENKTSMIIDEEASRMVQEFTGTYQGYNVLPKGKLCRTVWEISYENDIIKVSRRSNRKIFVYEDTFPIKATDQTLSIFLSCRNEPRYYTIKRISDSPYTLEGLLQGYHSNENHGLRGISGKEVLIKKEQPEKPQNLEIDKLDLNNSSEFVSILSRLLSKERSTLDLTNNQKINIDQSLPGNYLVYYIGGDDRLRENKAGIYLSNNSLYIDYYDNKNVRFRPIAIYPSEVGTLYFSCFDRRAAARTYFSMHLHINKTGAGDIELFSGTSSGVSQSTSKPIAFKILFVKEECKLDQSKIDLYLRANNSNVDAGDVFTTEDLIKAIETDTESMIKNTIRLFNKIQDPAISGAYKPYFYNHSKLIGNFRPGGEIVFSESEITYLTDHFRILFCDLLKSIGDKDNPESVEVFSTGESWNHYFWGYKDSKNIALEAVRDFHGIFKRIVFTDQKDPDFPRHRKNINHQLKQYDGLKTLRACDTSYIQDTEDRLRTLFIIESRFKTSIKVIMQRGKIIEIRINNSEKEYDDLSQIYSELEERSIEIKDLTDPSNPI